ncbi:DUF6807 domain-containing protein [Draconibacterium halophilum]|uniref:Methane oxygenase PmoA n=1 Tax=Draconibacterium halophilum TaxID=2706887 RepID=A0A6C0RFX5_9BACT|nr:PmoA family protein [Draconibacterium halophilum]QIA08423.1 hypothetical protein G0Q07_12185 [Draconibacterium halophilum]
MKRLFALLLFFVLFSNGLLWGQLTMKKQSDGIKIVDGSSNVLFYQMKPLNKDGAYERCNYIHPLWGLNGKVLTEDFPADHLHHRGVFWAWHQVWIGDKRIGDPWEIEDFEQEITEIEFIKDPDKTIWLKSEVLWSSDKWKKNGEQKPYIRENVSIHVHESSLKNRRIDFEISLLALEENLRIGGSEDEKGYGGFSVRMILPDDVQFTGESGNIEAKNTAVESEGFVNISGSLGKGNSKAGIAIIDNKDNPGYPQNLILREKNSMQNIAWPGSEPVELSTTEPLVLKYSLIVYSGKLKSKRISKLIDQ